MGAVSPARLHSSDELSLLATATPLLYGLITCFYMISVAWHEEGHFTTKASRWLVTRHTGQPLRFDGFDTMPPCFPPSSCGHPSAPARVENQGNGVAMT